MMIQRIPLDKIVVPEVRASSHLTPEQEEIFRATVAKYGIINPVVVRPLGDGRYELIAGKSRIEELKRQGNTEVDARVVEADSKDALIMHLAENMARGTNDPVSEGAVMAKFLEAGGTVEELARLTGHSEEWVKLRLAINKLPEVFKDALRDGVIGVGHVALAAQLPTPEETYHALECAVRLRWTQSVMENYVRQRMAELEVARAQENIQAPPPLPSYEQADQISRTYVCSSCNRALDKMMIRSPPICEECWNLLRYAVSQLGEPGQAMREIYQAVSWYRDYLRFKAAQQELAQFEYQWRETGQQFQQSVPEKSRKQGTESGS